MAFDDFVGEVEADAQTGKGFSRAAGPLIETLEDACLVVWCDADAEVLYAHYSALAILEEADYHPICLRRVLDGVGNQIRENLADAILIGVDPYGLALFKDELVRGCSGL